MNVRNCRKCGKIFNYAMGPIICPQCKDDLEEKFKQVKEYIAGHPHCGISEVSRECDVEISQIQQWLREERLEFSSDSMVTMTCESCGTVIRSGRFCDKCKNEMVNGFNRSNHEPPKPVEKKDVRDNPKMRFLS